MKCSGTSGGHKRLHNHVHVSKSSEQLYDFKNLVLYLIDSASVGSKKSPRVIQDKNLHCLDRFFAQFATKTLWI